MRWDIGHHHPFPPEAIIEENTRYVDAGAVRIGVEVRYIDGLIERLRATYEGTPFEGVYREWNTERVAAARERQQRGVQEAPLRAGMGGGLSIHVVGAGDRHEYLRFDCLDGVPHYHYLRPWSDPAECDNHEVDWDEVAHGPMLPWALEAIRTRLPEMLAEAGGAHVAEEVDPARLAGAAAELEQLTAEASATWQAALVA